MLVREVRVYTIHAWNEKGTRNKQVIGKRKSNFVHFLDFVTRNFCSTSLTILCLFGRNLKNYGAFDFKKFLLIPHLNFSLAYVYLRVQSGFPSIRRQMRL